MKLKIDKVSYTKKPTDSMEIGSIINRLKETDPVEVSWEQLPSYIEKGNCLLAANYSDDERDISNAESISGLWLDIDSKDDAHKVTVDDMIKIIYDDFGIIPYIAYYSFSNVAGDRFRLIYRYTEPISIDMHNNIYDVFKHYYKGYIDPAVSNIGRYWNTTYGEDNVIIFDDYTPITPGTLLDIIESNRGVVKYKSDKEGNNERENPIKRFINDQVHILDFIEVNFPGELRKETEERYAMRCPIHQGEHDNFKAYENNSYFCFSECDDGGDLYKFLEWFYGTTSPDVILVELQKDGWIDNSVTLEEIIGLKFKRVGSKEDEIDNTKINITPKIGNRNKERVNILNATRRHTRPKDVFNYIPNDTIYELMVSYKNNNKKKKGWK